MDWANSHFRMLDFFVDTRTLSGIFSLETPLCSLEHSCPLSEARTTMCGLSCFEEYVK